jgi:hypothetical protein
MACEHYYTCARASIYVHRIHSRDGDLRGKENADFHLKSYCIGRNASPETCTDHQKKSRLPEKSLKSLLRKLLPSHS